jgi:hypothetical protein
VGNIARTVAKCHNYACLIRARKKKMNMKGLVKIIQVDETKHHPLFSPMWMTSLLRFLFET